MLLCLASFLVWLFISLSHLCSSISLSRCLVMSVYVLIVRFNFIQNSRIPICSYKLLIFLLQRALFSFHLTSLHAIWDNLFSFLVEVKFLHWASILSSSARILKRPNRQAYPTNSDRNIVFTLLLASC